MSSSAEPAPPLSPLPASASAQPAQEKKQEPRIHTALRKIRDDVLRLPMQVSKNSCKKGRLPTISDKDVGCDYYVYRSGVTFVAKPGTIELVPDTLDRARMLEDYVATYVSECRMAIENQNEMPHWYPREIAAYNIEEPLSGPDFEVVSIMEDYARKDPHLRCRMIHDHIIAPILMFSFFGPQHARILHAHFDDKNGKLVVAYSKVYDFQNRNVDNLELVTRWAMSRRTGETMTKAARKLQNEKEREAKLALRTKTTTIEDRHRVEMARVRLQVARSRENEQQHIIFERAASAEMHEAAAENATSEDLAITEREIAAERRKSIERHEVIRTEIGAEVAIYDAALKELERH
ncbi:hypothetical protein F5884DRAFT_743822 [Xylogone sp. PMI_703]|nr:hypothetical protein F5884DRAFT_743822 [Xylogone sp. PMI_703]